MFPRRKTERPICSVIVPAAGAAKRMQGIDKVMATLDDTPILIHTLRLFELCPYADEIIVVTREDLIVPIGQLCREWQLEKVTKIVIGGKERIHSVRAGLAEVRHDAELIAIHDGARPFCSQKMLEAVFCRAAQTGAAAPAIPLIDTVKRAKDGVVLETLDRENLVAIQTPQVFEASLIKAATEKAIQDGFVLTDDCAAVERIGMKISLTNGERTNIKITTPFDMMVGEGLINWEGEHLIC